MKTESVDEELQREFKDVRDTYRKKYPGEDFSFVLWASQKWYKMEMRSWKRLALLSMLANVGMLYITFLKG
jgi:hypothetical protein